MGDRKPAYMRMLMYLCCAQRCKSVMMEAIRLRPHAWIPDTLRCRSRGGRGNDIHAQEACCEHAFRQTGSSYHPQAHVRPVTLFLREVEKCVEDAVLYDKAATFCEIGANDGYLSDLLNLAIYRLIWSAAFIERAAVLLW